MTKYDMLIPRIHVHELSMTYPKHTGHDDDHITAPIATHYVDIIYVHSSYSHNLSLPLITKF